MNKKIIIIIFLVLVVIIAAVFIQKQAPKPQADEALWENYEVIEKEIDGKELKLVVADNYERRQQGLMYVRKPVEEFDGMIFLFEDKELHTFWNMNTFEDLTLYWMDDETIVGTSELPSIEKSKEIVRVSSPKPVNIVIEVIK